VPGNLDERNLMRTAALLLTALAAAAILAGTATASLHLPQRVSGTATWKPGAPTLVSEEDAQNLMEKTYDHVWCTGVPRFGHSGEWPDSTYRVFDCSVEHNQTICPGMRVKAIKAAKLFYFKLDIMRMGNCY
jgi:hypothetical protein